MAQVPRGGVPLSRAVTLSLITPFSSGSIASLSKAFAKLKIPVSLSRVKLLLKSPGTIWYSILLLSVSGWSLSIACQNNKTVTYTITIILILINNTVLIVTQFKSIYCMLQITLDLHCQNIVSPTWILSSKVTPGPSLINSMYESLIIVGFWSFLSSSVISRMAVPMLLAMSFACRVAEKRLRLSLSSLSAFWTVITPVWGSTLKKSVLKRKSCTRNIRGIFRGNIYHLMSLFYVMLQYDSISQEQPNDF